MPVFHENKFFVWRILCARHSDPSLTILGKIKNRRLAVFYFTWRMVRNCLFPCSLSLHGPLSPTARTPATTSLVRGFLSNHRIIKIKCPQGAFDFYGGVVTFDGIGYPIYRDLQGIFDINPAIFMKNVRPQIKNCIK